MNEIGINSNIMVDREDGVDIEARLLIERYAEHSVSPITFLMRQ